MNAERWTDRPASAAPAEDRAAARWRALRADGELDGAALERLQRRVLQAARPRPRRRVWRWQPAFVVLLLLGVGGIAAATVGAVALVKKVVRVVATPPPPATSMKAPLRRAPRARPVIVPAAEPPAPFVGPPPVAPDEAETEAPPIAHRRPPTTTLPAPQAPAPAPEEPPPAAAAAGEDAAEVALFSTAMRLWRSGAPVAALRRLDEYLGNYPQGHFADEARVVRVDALVALDRDVEALASLRTLPLDRMPRGAELRLVRGELAAKAGQCRQALPDFQAVLDHDRQDILGPRALYARASCRAQLGDEVGAETDLRLYLMRYPRGPHVGAVKRALAR